MVKIVLRAKRNANLKTRNERLGNEWHNPLSVAFALPFGGCGCQGHQLY